MIDLSYMQDRRIAVMGLGLSGMVARKPWPHRRWMSSRGTTRPSDVKRPRREEFLSHHYWIRTGRASTADSQPGHPALLPHTEPGGASGVRCRCGDCR